MMSKKPTTNPSNSEKTKNKTFPSPFPMMAALENEKKKKQNPQNILWRHCLVWIRISATRKTAIIF